MQCAMHLLKQSIYYEIKRNTLFRAHLSASSNLRIYIYVSSSSSRSSRSSECCK